MLSFIDTFRIMVTSTEKLGRDCKREDCKHINNIIHENTIVSEINKPSRPNQLTLNNNPNPIKST